MIPCMCMCVCERVTTFENLQTIPQENGNSVLSLERGYGYLADRNRKKSYFSLSPLILLNCSLIDLKNNDFLSCCLRKLEPDQEEGNERFCFFIIYTHFCIL